MKHQAKRSSMYVGRRQYTDHIYRYEPTMRYKNILETQGIL